MTATASAELCHEAAKLLLYVCLRGADRESRWNLDQWDVMARHLDPRELAVVSLHVVLGWSLERCGEWLGVSRGRADQLYRRALTKLAPIAGGLL